jgi:hypothetical protein
MTPLVIGLAAVVMVILIAVAVGMRYVRNEERADLADREEDGGRTDREHDRPRGRPNPDWRRTGQQGPQRPSARAQDSGRQRRPGELGYDQRPGRGEQRGYGDADRGQDDRRHDGGGRGGHGDRRDELARPQQRAEALPQLRARQPRGRRNDDGDWPSTEWDKLSDADYWKEVASDRPLTTTARTAQPAQAPRPVPLTQARDTAVNADHMPGAGLEPRRGQESRPGRDAGRNQDAPRGQDPRRDAARPPGRSALEPAAAGGGHDFLTAPPAARYPEPVRPEPAPLGRGRPEQARPRPDRPGMTSPGAVPASQRAAAPMPYDDDPLTSPSFPKVVTSDSRSYGNGRPSPPVGRPSEYAARPAGQAAYNAPTAQFASYGSAGARPADSRTTDGYGRGFADSSATTAPHSYGSAAPPPAGSYPVNGHANGHHSSGYATGTGPGSLPGPQQPARPPAARPLPAVPPPAGNPYGSYVSAELPGYADNPTAVYSRDQVTRDYPGYPAGPANGHTGPANGHASPAYSYDLPLGDSAPPLGQSGSWYPEVPAAMAPVPSPGGPAPLPYPDQYPHAAVSGHDNGNGQHSPSGYAPGPYTDGHYDVPGYPPGAYGTHPAAPVYPPVGADSARQLDAAGYLPPEFYGGDGYGGQRR